MSPTHTTLYIDTFDQLIRQLLELRGNDFWSFRGQRKHDWPLGLHKIKVQKDDDDLDLLLMHFKKRCMEFPKPEHVDHDPWHWLFLAQHHKLRTRLLDWTTNPLVALYFAVENILSLGNDGIEVSDERYEGGDFGAVWALKVHKNHFKTPEEIVDPKNVTDWIMINPPPVSPRIVRQSGKFSYHPFEQSRFLDCMPRRDDEELVKIIIQNKRDANSNPSKEIRKQLGIMNIHHAALFPDADGVANFLNSEWLDIAISYHAQRVEKKSHDLDPSQ